MILRLAYFQQREKKLLIGEHIMQQAEAITGNKPE